jgi:flagellar hook-length control protein FliK
VDAEPEGSSAVEPEAPAEPAVGVSGAEAPDPSSLFSAPTMTILSADAREARSPAFAMTAQAAPSPLPATSAPATAAALPATKLGLPADASTVSVQTEADDAAAGNARPTASGIAITAAPSSTPTTARIPVAAPAKDASPTQSSAPLLAHPQHMDDHVPRRPLASAIAQALRGPDPAAQSTALATSASETLAAPLRLAEWLGESSPGREAAASGSRFDGTSASVSFAAVPGSTPSNSRAAAVTIGTPVGQTEFASDVGQQIVMLAGSRARSAELALTPAELGPVRVSIEMRGQEATVVLAAAAAATRTALEEALPRLREMFAQQGLNLAEASVNAQLGQDSPHADGRSGANATGSRNDGIEKAKEAESQSASVALRRPVRLIDVTA